MASEPIGQGKVFGDDVQLNKISYNETDNTVKVTGKVDDLLVEVKGVQTWSGGQVKNSLFDLQEPGSASNALFVGENRLTMNVKSSNNAYEGSAAGDSIRFGKASRLDVVNLGNNDGAGDIVDIKQLKNVKRLSINEFGSEDSLKVGGKTYNYDQLQDKSFKNISIKFD
jgi:hypothetical protein